MADNKHKFNVEYQYQEFLTKMGMKEANMNSVQRVVMRQAFFGAAGQMMVLLRDEFAEMDAMEGVLALEAMIKEIAAFWQEEVHTFKSKFN